MVDLIGNIITNASTGTVLIICTMVVLLVILLPKAVRKLGIKKFAGIELNTQNDDYNLQHAVATDIMELDTTLKESLWEYTEDLLMDFAEQSPLTCDAAIGHVLGGIFGHMRAHIMLNHLTDKLAVRNEEQFVKKLTRNVRASLSDAKRSIYDECPCRNEMMELSVDRYRPVIDQWLNDARIMVIETCRAKIDVYRDALERVHGDYWKDVFRKCIEKNERYIDGLEERRSSRRRRDDGCEG